jgi:hypothetical protein
MLSASDLSPNVQLVGTGLGELAGVAEVQGLQQALTGLAMAAGWPAANPGAVTGSVTPQTVMAVGAVVSNLGGKIDDKIKTALQVGLALAASSTTAMGAAKNLVSQYAGYLRPAVLALTAKYTKSSAPPVPPVPPSSATPTPSMFTTAQFKAAMAKGVATAQAQVKARAAAAKFPPGSIQTQSKTGLFRVAVPSGSAGQLGGPNLSLGAAFQELPPRTTAAPNVRFVSESQFEKETDPRPFYKKPRVLGGIAAGVAILGGGAWYLTRR